MQNDILKPYLLRALHECCSDQGLTPYITILVDKRAKVPQDLVQDGTITFDVSHKAVGKLQMGNEYVEFQARFSGKMQHISFPVGSVAAMYARENGQGMAFEVRHPPAVNTEAPVTQEKTAEEKRSHLALVK